MTTKKRTFTDFDIDLAPILTGPASDVARVSTSPYDPGPPIPNLHPRLNGLPYRIALIGEAPGEAEAHHLIPFCPTPTPGNPKAGSSGRLLNEKLSQLQILRDACFIGNIVQRRPPSNDISFFNRVGVEFTEGLQQLEKDLAQFNPHICVLMGKTALWAAKGVENITDWRGSLFIGEQTGPFLGRKCIATFHPAACLRQYEWMPLFYFDLKKAKDEATSPTLLLPSRDLYYDLPLPALLEELDGILTRKPQLSMDIEGYWNNLQCISLAESPFKSVLVPFTNMDGSSYWSSVDDEVQVWDRIIQIMSDPLIPKTWQNGLYDRFVYQYGYNLIIYGCKDDTMLKFFEMWCELEKGLAFQNSILGREPYYKFERRTDDRATHFRYCCKDSATTFENNAKLESLLSPEQKRHYQFNHQLLNPLLYMEVRGIRYDQEKAKDRLKETNLHIGTHQYTLDRAAGFGLSGEVDRDRLQQRLKELCCYKRDPSKVKSGMETTYSLGQSVLSLPRELEAADLGRFAQFLGVSLNIKSPTFKRYLYETLSLPKQYKESKDGTRSLTADYEALIKLSKLSPHPSIRLALEIGVLRTRAQMLEIHADPDGRIRCGYNIVGTETGRITCYTSPTGSGYNLQTIPKEDTLKPADHPLRNGMRDLFIADPGCYIFECDLSGADGWTVGAYLAMLGDSTMLDDLRAGLKPAQVVCYLLRHGAQSLTGKSRLEIKTLLQEVHKEDWDYFACKIGIWGTCYTMGPRKLANVFLTQSEGKLDWSEAKVSSFQAAVKTRYRISLWHTWAQKQLRIKTELTAPNGFKRRFFGRYNEILGEYLAHLPQVITTWATNTAMWRLWNDKENRIELEPNSGRVREVLRNESGRGDGERSTMESLGTINVSQKSSPTPTLIRHRLRVEPLHQVHDALVGQFRIEDTPWAVDKIKSWFANPITIAGQKITIPFSGSYGHNWALDSSSEVGKI